MSSLRVIPKYEELYREVNILYARDKTNLRKL
jgi:hypothetical protein